MNLSLAGHTNHSDESDRHADHAMLLPAATVLLAGGGSGGHISPGLAIAERLIERSARSRAVFACSERAIDADMLREAGAEFFPIPAAPVSLHPARLVRFLARYGTARHAAVKVLRQVHPTHVVALGGFVAAPVVAAAVRLGVPVTLVNLDAKPGRANRWMARHATRVLSAVETPSAPTFARRIERIVGMPLRRIALAPAEPGDCRQQLGLDPGRPTLLVTGASQGATSLNRLMVAIASHRPDVLRGWQVVHLAGSGADAELRAAYQRANVPAAVLPFLHRIGLAWGAADLAVSRAGANSVAEAAANAIPTLFLPYPYHRDLHQRLNAEPLVQMGGAALAEDRVEPDANLASVLPLLEELLGDAARRERMRTVLRSRPPADAAGVIAETLLGANVARGSAAER